MIKIFFSVFLLFVLSNLYSCSPSGVLASGGATTMVVAEGDRSLGTVVDDATIKINISAKFINSNAIVISKGLATVGIGIGQTNRIDSVKQAIKRKKTNFGNVEAVLASDGFFPFPDIVKICSKNKIKAIIQPGGSLNDNSVIKEAKKQNINLVFTGIRHFKH